MDYEKKLKLLSWVYFVLSILFLLAFLYPLSWWFFHAELTMMEFTKEWWIWYVAWAGFMMSLDWFLTKNHYFMKP